MSDFPAGSVVRLKSGGPLMTVGTHRSGSSTVPVYWFADDRQQTADIPTDCLTHSACPPGVVVSQLGFQTNGGPMLDQTVFYVVLSDGYRVHISEEDYKEIEKRTKAKVES
jgi:uncharacterized protein YodC (DUF2158 family)